MSQQISTVRKFYDLFYNERRFAEGAALLSEGFVNHHPGAHGIGREGMIDDFSRLGPPPSFRLAPIRVAEDGDLVWVLAHATGIGPVDGMAIDLWRFEGDLIVEHWDAFRRLEADEAPAVLFAGLGRC